MSTYAIGDIQGCYQSLMALLDAIHFDANHDRLWFAGDLVNRGPRSLETIQFVMSLKQQATVVLGNHDLYLLAVYYDAWNIRPMTTLQAILNDPQVDQIMTWLRHQPLIHSDTDLGYTMLHAGLYPAWSLAQAVQLADEVHQILQGEHIADFLTAMYGNDPNRWNDQLSGEPRLRFIVNAFTRMRYLTTDLQLDLHHKGPIGEAPEHLIPWFDCPQLKLPNGMKLLFGHWASLQGNTGRNNIIGLDTGCGWGERLTAMRLEDGEIFSVPFQD